MPNAAQGYTLAALESTFGGIQQLLSETAVSALPASLTSSTALTAANTGMHLMFVVWAHTATGTISSAGTAPNSLAAVTSTSTTLEIRPTNDFPYAVYVTPEIYGAVNASGITVSGLTNGRLVIYGIQAATRLLPGEVKFNDKRKDYLVKQQRGTFAPSHMPPVPLTYEPDWEFAADIQPDSTYLLVPAGFSSSVTTTALPAGGTQLLASTSVTASGNASASTQPTAPGMVVQIALSGSPTTAQTVSVTGTNLDGETLTEVVVPSTKTAGTWTSKTVFQSIASNGIAWGAFGAGNIVVTGFYGWQYQTTPTDPMASVTFYQWDSVGNRVIPFGVCNEWELAGGWEKEAKLAMKGMGQIVGHMGNIASASQQGPALVQSQDLAITGWQSVAYIDAISGTAGTTQQTSVRDWKLSGKNMWETIRTGQFYPPYAYFSRAYHNRHEVTLEMTLDMLIADYQNEYAGAFKKGTRRLVQLWCRHSNPIATISGTPYYLGFKLNFVVRWMEDPQLKYELNKPNVEITLKAIAYLDAVTGYDAQITWVTRLPSWS